jgi:SEC-C motif
MSTIHQNHYVPIWYQKRFLALGQGSFFYLDFNPEEKQLPDGRIITMNNCHQWHPKSCFWEQDLYTTSVFGAPNDEIERYLFGTIDGKGSAAVRALAMQDLGKLHLLFWTAFEYLDAQKLRTPKGLDWIKSRYPSLTQIELMLEMQQLRRMHCTMWVEAAREIVSAEDSHVKFIVTDHPVTIYNAACPPKSDQCKYPNDPSIIWKASQTIFPLDLDHCLILTNLEYAREPNGVDPISNRAHARYFGRTLAKFDTMINTRRLGDKDVASINYILKARARRFIAAANKEWLYPEAMIQGSWSEVGNVLLPPQEELWHFGGEVYVGGENGKLIHYQDEFGRTLGENKSVKKEAQKGKTGNNDLCTCGSGKKYKKCCRDKPESERPSNTEYSVRERNLILFNAAIDILGLSKGKTWEDVRRELSDEQVRNIHGVVASLWPKETNLFNLLPKPDLNTLRGLYTGIVDPRVVFRNVISFSFYADEIILLSPFTNPAIVKEEYSPFDSPSKFKQETLKNVLLLMQLAPFIDAGIVNLIPDPCDFDSGLREKVWNMAKERLGDRKPNRDELHALMRLQKEDFLRDSLALPDDSLKHQIKAAEPTISDDVMQEVLEQIKEKRISDPLALLQSMAPGEKGAQLKFTRFGPNLELGLFLSQITGSFIYTDSLFRWRELLGTLNGRNVQQVSPWELIGKSLEHLPFTFIDQADFGTAVDLKKSGRFGELRKILRQISISVQSNLEPNSINMVAQRHIEELKKAHLKAQAEWRSIQDEFGTRSPLTTVNGTIDYRIPPAGFGLNTVYRLLVSHFGRDDYMEYMPMALFIKFQSE